MNFFKALALFVSSYITNPAKTVEALQEAQKIDYKPILEGLINTLTAKIVEIQGVQGVKLDLDSFPMATTRLIELKKAYKEMSKQANGQGIGLFVEYMEKGKKSKQSKSLRGKDQVEAFIKKAESGDYTIL
jgi:hypothetical protein